MTLTQEDYHALEELVETVVRNKVPAIVREEVGLLPTRE